MIDSCVTVKTIPIRFLGFKNNNYFIKLDQLKDITGDANGSKHKIYSVKITGYSLHKISIITLRK